MKKITFFLTVFICSCLATRAGASLEEYAAKYKFPQGSIISEANVTFDNGTLHLNSSLGTTSLEITGDDKFYMPANSGTVVFIRNGAKKITGIKFDLQNVSVDGNREEKDADVNIPSPIYKSVFPIRNLPAVLTGEEME